MSAFGARAPAVPKWLAVLAALLLASCAAPPGLMTLPSAPSSPAPDAPAAFASATAACRGVSTFTAEIAASGSVGGRRIPHAHLIVGLTRAGAVRLEATVPLGASALILVVRPASATSGATPPSAFESTLLLPRDNRVLQSRRPEDVFEAITGVPLGPLDFRDVLTGCAQADGAGAHRGERWIVMPYLDGSLYLNQAGAGAPWQIVAETRSAASGDAWRVEYRDFHEGLPQMIRLSAYDHRFDIALALSQVDLNTTIDDGAFTVKVPASATPITLDELRRSGPLQ